MENPKLGFRKLFESLKNTEFDAVFFLCASAIDEVVRKDLDELTRFVDPMKIALVLTHQETVREGLSQSLLDIIFDYQGMKGPDIAFACGVSFPPDYEFIVEKGLNNIQLALKTILVDPPRIPRVHKQLQW